MHLLFDHRLTDPTEVAVRAALKRACSTINGKRRTGTVNLNDSSLRTLGKRTVGEREGQYQHHGNRSSTDVGGLALVWWTNPGRRKLVRIRGWREPYRQWSGMLDDPQMIDQRELATRPMVWHLDPERMTVVDADGTRECVAVCGCGATGSPESLAWAGGMCGPCRDRIEEHGPESVNHEPGLLTAEGFNPKRAVFTAVGERVVAVGGNAYRVWDTRTGTLVSSGEGTVPQSLDAISPNGECVLLCGEHTDVAFHEIPTGRNGIALPHATSILGIHWTGRRGELLVQRYHNRELELVSISQETSTPQVFATTRPPLIIATLHDIHPDGPRAVFSESGNVVVSRVGRKGELHTLHQFRLGVGQYDRTGNWNSAPKLVRFTADGERILFVSQYMPDEYLELWNPAKPRALLQVTFPARIRDVQFSPDGEHLFILGEDSTVYVCHPGLITHIRARLRWHALPAHSLAVSPDSKMLATCSPEGVKLWPAARLLEVL